jgi:hypothetical protein
MDGDDPNVQIDSAGLDYVLGSNLVTVDVQGGLSSDQAMSAAIDLASQQAACLTDPEPCESATRPAALAGPTVQ